jgi:hypothetical protein
MVSLPLHKIVSYGLLGRKYLFLRSLSTEGPRPISARFGPKGVQKNLEDILRHSRRDGVVKKRYSTSVH